jgi:hypothetical protein
LQQRKQVTKRLKPELFVQLEVEGQAGKHCHAQNAYESTTSEADTISIQLSSVFVI